MAIVNVIRRYLKWYNVHKVHSCFRATKHSNKYGSFIGGPTSFIEVWLKLSLATWELKRNFVKFPIFALVLVSFKED